MQIVKDIDRARWDEFIASSPASPILQTFEWGEVKRAQGWKPIRLAVEEKGKIIAAAQVLKRKLPLVNRTLFYCPRGPVVDFENEKVLDFLLSGIKEEAKKHKAILLKIDPEITQEINLKNFIAQKKQVQPRSTIYLDLTKSLDDLLKSCSEKTRYNIRLSGKKGVTVKEMPSEEGVEIFYRLYQETAGRDNFLIHSKLYYQKIKEQLIDNGMAQIFVAYLKEEPIAGIFTFTLGKKIWYMYGASLSSHRNVMPNHALHWEVIKWAKGKGFELYDLWGIPSNPKPGHPLWGVYRFKKGFNGRVVKLVGALDLVYDPVFNFVFNTGVNFHKNLRSLLAKGKIIDSLEE